jgi:hypothetical protein
MCRLYITECMITQGCVRKRPWYILRRYYSTSMEEVWRTTTNSSQDGWVYWTQEPNPAALQYKAAVR